MLAGNNGATYDFWRLHIEPFCISSSKLQLAVCLVIKATAVSSRASFRRARRTVNYENYDINQSIHFFFRIKVFF